ncbi:MAG: hypothetical protein CBC09_05625 [Cellvibrionales bacterium TMED49]|nr:hypothetical protein [Porticoccaceae bacterium]OUU38468.1 MAG: hypothetical protein CBC09_05625 [Cellvibrionales bacterium TMED49]
MNMKIMVGFSFKNTLAQVTAVALLSAFFPAAASGLIAKKTNILWVWVDDQHPWYGTYGDMLVETPNIDNLADTGAVFERAYAPAPVCSTSRSAIATGSYPIRIGAHDHRSSRVPENQIYLLADVKTVPTLFLEAGYETYNDGKDDFNFSYNRSELYSLPKNSMITSEKTYPPQKTQAAKSQSKKSENKGNFRLDRGSGHWSEIPVGMSFFGQTSISGGKGDGSMLAPRLKSLGYTPVKSRDVRVPKQYPDIPEVREKIAGHYNSILQTDHELGSLIQSLKEDGRWEDTIIFLFSDHGSNLPRSKEFCYEEGLHVPLIISGPGATGKIIPGTRRKDLVNLFDISATALSLAGLEIPSFMDSKDVFASDYERDYVFSSADRMSNVIDRVRSVMGDRYHYIRNFKIDRPLFNWGYREVFAAEFPDKFGYFLKIRDLATTGKLTPAQAAPYGPRRAEELYDLKNDPDEVVNLADNPKHRQALEEMRIQLKRWIKDTDDKGQYPRSSASLAEVMGRFPRSALKSPEYRVYNP